MTALLTDLEAAVEAVATEQTEPAVVLACLRALGLEADETRLADAVELWRAWQGLLDGSRDVYRYGDAAPRAGVNVRDWAITRCENDLRACIEALARPKAVAV